MSPHVTAQLSEPTADEVEATIRCAAAVAVALAEAVLDAQQSAELVVLDHHGNTLHQQVLNPIEPTQSQSASLKW